MSILGITSLNQIIEKQHIQTPAAILQALETAIRQTLTSRENESHDGMDMALVCYNHQTKNLTYAGAINPILYFSGRPGTHHKRAPPRHRGRPQRHTLSGPQHTNRHPHHPVPLFRRVPGPVWRRQRQKVYVTPPQGNPGANTPAGPFPGSRPTWKKP